MNCIIVDDEPLARRAIEILIEETGQLNLVGIFNNATSAARFMETNTVDLVFLDIQMPKVTGMEFARSIKGNTLIVFTTAYTEYALESYEIDAIDYLVKPVESLRFRKAVSKALSYHALLAGEKGDSIETFDEDFIFIRSDRRYYKIELDHILFVEGLKDYVIIQCEDQRLITRMNLKNIQEDLPELKFFRVSKSNIVNLKHIHSFDNNSVFIQNHEIAIGSNYRDAFLERFMKRKRK